MMLTQKCMIINELIYDFSTKSALSEHYLPEDIFRNFSSSCGMFCLKSFSLLRSIGGCFTRILRTWIGAPSGGQGQNLNITGSIGLCKLSANIKSLMQLSLWRYFGVIQQSTANAARILRCILLWVDSGTASSECMRLFRPLCPRCCSGIMGLISDQQTYELDSRWRRMSSTLDCMSHW